MGSTSTISFPGLGIGEFKVNSVAFHIGNLRVTWYGIIICLGIICAFSYFCFRAMKAGIDFDTLLDYALITVPVAIICARAYYVIFNFSSSDYKSFYDIIAVWNGGLAIYGGIIGGALTVLIICKVKKIKFFVIADALTPGVMIGQIIGRWGNFMNGEAFGGATTLPWRMRLSSHYTGYVTMEVHPTFLYESLWNLIGFILINIFYKKKKFNGEITLWYFGWYGLGRFFIEQLRTDSLYIGNTGIRVSAMVGLVCILVALPAVIVGRVRHAALVGAGEISRSDVADITTLFGIKKKDATEKSAEEAIADIINRSALSDNAEGESRDGDIEDALEDVETSEQNVADVDIDIDDENEDEETSAEEEIVADEMMEDEEKEETLSCDDEEKTIIADITDTANEINKEIEEEDNGTDN